MQQLAFCPHHGLFQAKGNRIGPNAKRAALLGLTYSCPFCRTASEVIPGEYSMYGDRLNVLVDPAISADALMALRSIVLRLQRGELTAEEAERQASEASPRLGGLLNFRTWPLEARSIVIAALITAAGEVIGARTAPPDVTNVHVAAIVERAVELPKKAAQRKARARKPKPKAPKPKL